MHIGFIGLGKMGFNLVSNLIKHGHTVVGYDINEALVNEIKTEGAQGVNSLTDLYGALPEKRVLWLMIPAGPLVDNVIEQLLAVMQPGDVVIDGGNSHYKDSIRRHNSLKEKGIGFLDCGTSGGISGALNGACTMVGGTPTLLNHYTLFSGIFPWRMAICTPVRREVDTLPKWCTTALNTV